MNFLRLEVVKIKIDNKKNLFFKMYSNFKVSFFFKGKEMKVNKRGKK